MYYHPKALPSESRSLAECQWKLPSPAVDGVSVKHRWLVCENSKFQVFFDHVVDSTGPEVPNYLVVSPRQHGKDMLTGIAILPLMAGRIGLIRIYRPPIRSWSWEIPHGFIEHGESGQESATRELGEEAGLVAGSIASLGFITPDSGVLAARVELFLARDCSIVACKQAEIGLRELTFFSVAEFEQMILRSEIQDTFTIAAWCHVRLSPDSLNQTASGNEEGMLA